MKKILYSLILAALAGTAYAQQNYELGKPNKSDYRYLDNYNHLKTYIDHDKYPNFKLGAGTTVSDYLNNSNTRGMINNNFSETVAGNAMKMSSCVNNNGTMNFSTVTNYVNKATESGLSVYGHTLAWHSQQPKGWLLSLIKDKPAEPIPGADTPVIFDVANKDFRTQKNIGWHSDFGQYGFSVSYSDNDGLIVHCTKKTSQNYEVQYVAMDGIPAESGKRYKVTFTVKGSSAGYLTSKMGDFSGGPYTNVNFTTEWQDVSVEYNNTINSPFLLLQHGFFIGDVYIKNIKVQEVLMGKTVTEARRCLVVDVAAKQQDAGDTQFHLRTNSFSAGSTYTFSALVRADKKATVETKINPGGVNCPIGKVEFSPMWQTVTSSGTLNSDGSSILFNLSVLNEDNRFFFDDVSLKINGEERLVNGDFEGTDLSTFKLKKLGTRLIEPTISDEITYLLLPTSTPLTPEEKHDALVGAMDKWISGMMKACNGKVKAWDVVNEAISGGGNDGQGNYTLQHSEGYNSGTWDVGGDAFYWQDYMGDLEYVRQAVRLARKYGPEDIKLFINDYNLESDWDDNKKLKSLINWIKKWESDGVTYVDGIGTQMHISYYKNPNTLASKKRHITKMFELMAASGKLVRVSEMDMGYQDINDKTVPTTQLTSEMDKEMADYYEWIISEFFRIVPPEQQWGICQWCTTDAPGSITDQGGWRNGQPVGIWDLNKNRKHVYAGFVRGLNGSEPTAIEQVVEDNKNSDLNGIVFDLQGRRLSNASDINTLPTGLYIVNGKKIFVK